MANDSFKHLWEKYVDETMQPEEFREWSAMLQTNEYEQEVNELLEKAMMADHSVYTVGDIDFDKIYNNVVETRPALRPIHFFKKGWFRYAAAILLIAGIGTYLYNSVRLKTTMPVAINHTLSANDLPPGSNKATLTLSDGSIILLDAAATGKLAEQGSTKILKLNSGALVYSAGRADGTMLYNTITTPKGGQYQVILPDGSKVWLNAASGIRFPTVFEKDRRVEITGEVYFEVIKKADKPFIVKTHKDEITVLGTAFNVNSYTDETTIKTSLLEGAVSINNRLLSPGEAYQNGKIVKTDLAEDLAWKNGEFIFRENASIEDIMRPIARWYDVDVLYKGKVQQRFWGSIPRSVNLSQVLKVLEGTGGVKFEVEGKKIIVMP